ncbi:MAG: hypothetical protein AAF351_00030 [Pseudomonadota bacterium]
MEVFGLGALGFWIFLAAIIVGGMWFDSQKRESQQETLRRIVESGRQVDAEMINRLVNASDAPENPDQDLKVGGIITAFAAGGLLVLGWFLGRLDEEIFNVMQGVAGLVLVVAIGLYIAGVMTKRWQQDQ